METTKVYINLKEAWNQKEILKSKGIHFQYQELKTMTNHYMNGECHSIATNEIYIITIIE